MKRYEQDSRGQVRKGIKHRKISHEEIRQHQQEKMEMANYDDD